MKSNAKYFGYKFIVLLLIATLIFISIFAVFDSFEIIGGVDDTYFNSAEAVGKPSNPAALDSRFGAFEHNSTYTFTDKEKVEGYREGRYDSDKTTITVDTTQPHGSQKNPYVIDTIARWGTFAKEECNNSTLVSKQTEGKYYVLGADLDFANEAVSTMSNPTSANAWPTEFDNMCNWFAGTFYGLGHKISNFRADGNFISNYPRSPILSLGLFHWTSSDTTITDFIFDNYEFVNAPPITGSIIAAYCAAYSGDYTKEGGLLNCYARGSITRDNPSYSTTQNESSTPQYQVYWGGLVGSVWTTRWNDWTQIKMMIYRCSADTYMYVRNGATVAMGGIVGILTQGGILKMYDNFARIVGQTYGRGQGTDGSFNNHGTDGLISGSAIGYAGGFESLLIDGFAGQAYFPEGATIAKGYEASLFGYCGPWETSSSDGKTKRVMPCQITVKNTYTCADLISKTNATASTTQTTWCFPWSGNRIAVGQALSDAGTTSATNVHFSGLTSANKYPSINFTLLYMGFSEFLSYGYPSLTSGQLYYFKLVDSSTNKQVTKADSSSALQSDARTFFGADTSANPNNSKIWDSSKITFKTSFTSKSALSSVSVNDSPVYSALDTRTFKIKYRNYFKNGTTTEAGEDDTYTTRVGSSSSAQSITLTPATMDGRRFVGWTFSPSNPEILPEISEETSSGRRYYGDLTVYAVWDITSADPATISIANNITAIGGETLEDGTLQFEYDGSHQLRLSPKVEGSLPSGFEISYNWLKDGVQYRESENIFLQQSADSGTYTLQYKLTSTNGNEPLAYSHNWIRVQSTQKVNIRKWSAIYQENSLSFNGKKAYVGMPFGELPINADMRDKSNQPIQGTFSWSTEGGNTIDPEKVTPGAVEGTYKYTKKFVFTPTGSAAANYDPTEVEVEFNVEYLYLSFVMKGVVNPLNLEVVYGQNYTHSAIANAFEKAFFKEVDSQNPNFTSVTNQEPFFNGVSIKDYRNQSGSLTIKSTTTINVEFKDIEYTVTFKVSGADDHIEKYKYGQALKDTSDWLTLPDGYILVGWNTTFINDQGLEEVRHWDFDNDRISGDTTLTAETLQLQLKGVDEFTVTAIKTTFNALDKVTPQDLRVKVVYTTNNTNYPTYTRYLSSKDYTIKYEKGTALHFDAPSVTVSYTFGTEYSQKVPFTVNKLPIDISGVIDFVDSSDFYEDGNPRTLPVVGTPYPTGVGNISYEYFDMYDNPITADQITGSKTNDVTYTIRAIFEPASADYSGTEKTIKFTVYAEPVLVRLVWESTSLPFNGQAQFPKAKVVRVDNGQEITALTLQYSGDIDKVNRGTGYRVKASISSKAFKIDGDDFCVFSIDIAEVEVPTLPRELTYIGADIDLRNILLNFDPKVIKAAGDYIVRNASDSYSITFSLVDSTNYRFKSGNSTETLAFSVAKAPLTVRWDNLSFVFDGNAYGPKVIGFVELLGEDAANFNFDTQIIYTDERESAELGAHTIGMMFASNVTFRNNYVLSGQTVTYTILPGDGNYVFVTIEWSDIPEGGFIYNGEIQHPTFIVRDEQGNDITSSVTVNISGGYESSKYAKVYNCTATVSGSGDTLYIVTEGGTLTYEIKLDAEGNGTDPGDKDTPPSEGGGNVLDKIKEFIDNLIEKNFPLWQVATMAVAGLLTLIFLIKTVQYSKRKKKAKGEVKKLNAKTFAAIAPIFATDVAYAGLTNQIWSIIAFSLVGLALVMFIAALIARSAWKKAELAKEAAQEEYEQRKYDSQNANQLALQERISQIGGGDSNIAEILRQRDEEHRREMEELREEQAKRDEAMKLMLANLMGRNPADTEPIYGSIDDTDLLVQKVIAGLLPAVQQMMPEATAYLAAPSEENEELKALVEEQKALVEEQSEQIRNMSDQIASLQEQLTAMNEDRVEGVLLPDQSEEMKEISDQIAGLQEQLIAMTEDRVEGVLLPDESEEMKALTDKIAELQEQLITMSQQRVVVPNNQSEDIKALTDKIEELQDQLANSKSDTPDNSEEIKALTDKIAELQEQIANPAEIVAPDNSDEIKALTAEMLAMRKEMANLAQGNTTTVYVEKESEDDDVDDEEEWDSILDEDDDDFVEAVVIEEDGTVKKTSPNFRMRLKQSSDKNREWYTVIKNMFCSQKGVTYRVYKRVEKIRYQGQVVAVIGIAKRSIKLWLALKPYEYDARRYHHKDVSDKPRFVDVPMYVRVGSDRALTRAQELILALFQELNMEARKRYNDRSIQELIFTLKHNRLLTNKQNKQLLCEVMHVHDCDVLDDETAEKCIEAKNEDFIDDSVIETVKLDDIDAKFQDGNRVTLEKLKKVGLVSEECTGYTVVADKRLTKPLIIVANDFNLTAVKLITLTGGRAIKLQQV